MVFVFVKRLNKNFITSLVELEVDLDQPVLVLFISLKGLGVSPAL
jgi:hypothetical protein